MWLDLEKDILEEFVSANQIIADSITRRMSQAQAHHDALARARRKKWKKAHPEQIKVSNARYWANRKYKLWAAANPRLAKEARYRERDRIRQKKRRDKRKVARLSGKGA